MGDYRNRLRNRVEPALFQPNCELVGLVILKEFLNSIMKILKFANSEVSEAGYDWGLIEVKGAPFLFIKAEFFAIFPKF